MYALARRAVLAALLAATVALQTAAAQTLELPYEVEFSSQGIGNTMAVRLPTPSFDSRLGELVGATLRVDIDRTCGETLFTNHTRGTVAGDVVRNLQLSVADLVGAAVLTSRLPATTGPLPVQIPPNSTTAFNECGGATTLVFTNVPPAAAQDAARNGGLGLLVEVTPAPSPDGVTLDRFITLIEGRATIVWHFNPGQGNGATGWKGGGAWLNLGQGLADAKERIPSFMATGQLTAGEYYALVLYDVPPGAPTYLIAGTTIVDLPFKGGVMVPFPGIRIPMTATAEGAVVSAKRLPQHVANGGIFYLQFWVEDPTGPEGYSASNAVSGTIQ